MVGEAGSSGAAGSTGAEAIDIAPWRIPRRGLGLALLVALLIAMAAVGWMLRPRPTPPLTLPELQGIYAGMVRGDGTSQASVLTRQNSPGVPITVGPSDCAAAVEMPFANVFPTEAVDGVGTWWLGTETTSLFTFRFADETAARAEFDRVVAAVNRCDHARVAVRLQRERRHTGTLDRLDDGTDPDRAALIWRTEDGYSALQVWRRLNTLSWQYRYRAGEARYDPVAADQVQQSLQAQFTSVLADRPA